MEMTGLQIFKYLPGGKKTHEANCKKCGCPTCMAYALKLAKQNTELEKCPHISEDLRQKYLHSAKHAQETISIGDLKIGGENVLYRHEKTFINRTTLAVVVDCAESYYKEKLERISNFRIKGVNEVLTVDLVVLKNSADKDVNSSIRAITYEELSSLNLDIIEENDFQKTKDYLIHTRQKAVLEKDDKYSKPVCVYIESGNLYETCAHSSYYICKYANMLLFEDFDEAMFSTLLTLRQNIFTDPQKPLQVESNLYEFNNPDKDSIVFLTTNFALTFFAVANELENLDVPSYLVVIPADGMSVLTAWSAEKFTANIVAKTLDKLDVRNKLNTRKIIIPGLLAHTLDELKEAVPDFDFVVGTNEASAIGEFVRNFK